jgi:hypothetical protein
VTQLFRFDDTRSNSPAAKVATGLPRRPDRRYHQGRCPDPGNPAEEAAMPVRRFRLYAAAAAVALLLAGGGFAVGQAATAGVQHWQRALLDLQNAQLELQLAGSGPAGSRAGGAGPTGSRQRALMLVNAAILQVQRGMAGEP